MLPFTVQFKSGQPVYEQVIYAVHKALVTGQLVSGDAFPSVRQLSKDLKINPNTAQKIVRHLKQEGLLEVQPGRGTFVSESRTVSPEDRSALLTESVEELVVRAKKLGIAREQIVGAIEKQWEKL